MPPRYLVFTTTRPCSTLLFDVSPELQKTAITISAWLNLAVFLLRPCNRRCRFYTGGARDLVGVSTRTRPSRGGEPGKLAWWSQWRRIAGGPRQSQARSDLRSASRASAAHPLQAKKLTSMGKPRASKARRMWRVVASLRALPTHNKINLGDG